MKATELTELTWAAGFYEGEGHVFCRPRKSGFAHDIGIVISQKDREPLDHFSAVFGLGYIYLHKGGAGRPTLFQWHLHRAADVIAVMTLLRPWLSTRRQAQWDAAKRNWDMRSPKRVSKRDISKLEVLFNDHAV